MIDPAVVVSAAVAGNKICVVLLTLPVLWGDNPCSNALGGRALGPSIAMAWKPTSLLCRWRVPTSVDVLSSDGCMMCHTIMRMCGYVGAAKRGLQGVQVVV